MESLNSVGSTNSTGDNSPAPMTYVMSGDGGLSSTSGMYPITTASTNATTTSLTAHVTCRSHLLESSKHLGSEHLLRVQVEPMEVIAGGQVGLLVDGQGPTGQVYATL